MKHAWLRQILEAPAVAALAEAARPGRRVAAEGAAGSCGHLLAGALAKHARRPVLLLVAHLDEADEAADDLALFPDLETAVFPALEMMPGESHVSLELLADRLAVVGRLTRDEKVGGEAARGRQPDVLVASVQALMQHVPCGEALDALVLEVRRGAELGQGRLVSWLADAGYTRVDALEDPGEFAVRGGIVDVYPPGEQAPARIDFFGDEVDEIAEIDLASMGSDRKLPSVRLIGASADRVRDDEATTSLWSMLAPDTLVVQQETLEVAEQARGYYERLVDPTGIYPPAAVRKALGAMGVVEVNQFAAPGMADERFTLPCRSLGNFDSDAANAVRELGEWARGPAGGAAHRVVVLCERSGEEQRLRELIAEHAPDEADRIEIERGALFRGFVWGDAAEPPPRAATVRERGVEREAGSQPLPPGRGSSEGRGLPLALVPHHEMLHRYQRKRRIRRIGGPGRGGRSTDRAIDSFLDIETGDYVVHAHHGIALFQGLRTLRRDRRKPDASGEEYLTLEFADRALLHVPASQIELVHKYIGGFSGRPPLSKLGGGRWKKQKEQVAESVRDLAAQMLRLHAARESMPGIRYEPDTPWVRQFEAEFPYDETEDQLAAIAEIKKDMTRDQPMDRLICGDVGYGKTELAMRAAFKAVEGGKQVAVLCPTTVLCEQHERTFRERMADYPIRIEALNRFKSGGEARRILKEARAGAIDILIGTHRLLSDDLAFADLGMVVIDEEQKFGVEHKSKLMRLRMTVDVLTLSATPIPRTLHMSLLGLRDISSLSTPPADRRAVATDVIPYEHERIRHAIVRELNRGGQCFFVHNRVHNIRAVAAELKALVPEARFAVGHGQMGGRELEAVMLRFLRGEVDVLVCTTIIESGLDIPAANTMFIADADRFGLAEMHQLRGRVGRYKHRAYCYLLMPPSRPLSEVAQRRLRAIEEFAMLGAGFKIAMRDMELRGVGNILGAQQSGHIASVGYEMYCKLLEHATADLKRDPLREPAQTHLELKVAGALPRRYIPSQTRRMQAYRRVNRAPDLPTLRRVEREMSEAYGPLPGAAEGLVALAELRIALSRLEVESLKLDGPDLVFTTRRPRELSPRLEEASGTVRLVDTPGENRPGTIYYRPPPGYTENPHTLLAVLRKLLVQPMEEAQKETSAA